MNGFGFGRVLAVIAVVVILVGIGIGAYNAGIDQGIAQQAAHIATSSGGQAVTVVPAYGYGWGHGWGLFPFGFLFWILGFFLILGLLRAAFGRGRGWRGGHHGGWEDRRQMLDEWHRSAHGDEPRPPASQP